MRRGKRNHKKMVGSMSIIYITSILALSFMGVAYAALDDGLNLDIAIKSGYIQGRIKNINKSGIDLEDGEWISFEYSDDKQTLHIDGEVYPTFNGNIPIKILDEGSIPSILKNTVQDKSTDITELKKEARNKYSRKSFSNEDVVESFELNINPDNDKGKDSREMQRYSLEDQDEISNLQDQIDQYDSEEEYDFEYELLLEQAL